MSILSKLAVTTATAALALAGLSPALASSHREAPNIAKTPRHV